MRADVIIFYALNTPPATATGTPVPPTSVLPTVGFTSLTEGGLLQHFETDHAGPTLTGLNAAPTPGQTSKTVDTAFSSNSTFSFTVTPPAGEEFDLTSLTFHVASGGTANAPDPRATGIRSSLTGNTDLLVANLPLAPVSTLNETLSLGAGFQNITGPVTFTFAVSTPNGNDTIIFNDITLNGTVTPIPVPEPSSLALMGVGGLALAGWRRWRRKQASG